MSGPGAIEFEVKGWPPKKSEAKLLFAASHKKAEQVTALLMAAAKERTKILDEIRDVLKMQGVQRPNLDELDHLVKIQTWDAPCYEFAHFTDEELADVIMTVHHTLNGLSRDDLVASLAHSRGRDKDIKEVWSQWDYKVGKVKLPKPYGQCCSGRSSSA